MSTSREMRGFVTGLNAYVFMRETERIFWAEAQTIFN